MISVIGRNSFIGKRLLELYPEVTVGVNHRGGLNQEALTNNIINFTSTTNNYHLKDNKPHEDITVNLSYLIGHLDTARLKFGPNFTFTQISSFFVYGKHHNTIVDEDTYCNPKGMYSITKRCSEQILQEYCEEYGIKWRILRLSNIFGIGDRPTAKKNAFQYILGQMVENEPIKLYNNGNVYRDFLWVDDVCRFIFELVKNGPSSQIYNLGFGRSFTFRNLIDIAKNCSNYSGQEESIEPPSFHKRIQSDTFFMNTNKINQMGLYPSLDVRQWIPKYIEYLKNAKLSASKK